MSLLYALTGDKEILAAFRSAVDETMRDMEAEMKTRVRRDGKDEDRLTGNMVWAEFIHTTSRPVDGVPDPQLHAHCFVFNSTWDDEEEPLEGRAVPRPESRCPLFPGGVPRAAGGQARTWASAIDRKRDDFEIAGVPSRHYQAILAADRRSLKRRRPRRGITDPDRKAELGAETREKKNHELILESSCARNGTDD